MTKILKASFVTAIVVLIALGELFLPLLHAMPRGR